MFARQLNQIRIELSIKPRGPLLIRSGRKGADPSRPDLECVRTSVGGQPSVYIPGSSLKGVMRAHAERLLQSEGLGITTTFDEEAKGAFNQKTPGTEAYAGTCPLGRTFGTLHLKGHVAVADLVPGGREPAGSAARKEQLDAANRTEQRNGVSIDRLLGSARNKRLFDQEVVVDGRFDGRILLRNVQLYQLALVLLVLRDLGEGYTQLGSGTSRGNGFVTVDLHELRIETRAGQSPADSLAGVGGLSLAGELAAYKLYPGDQVERPAGLDSQTRLAWEQLVLRDASAIDTLGEALFANAGPWTAFLADARERQKRRETKWVA